MLYSETKHENRIHGSSMFPFIAYHVVLTPGPKQEVVGLHWHEEMEFVLAAKGDVRMQIGTDVFTIPYGEAAFVHSGELHAMEAPSLAESEFYAIVFNHAMLNSAEYDAVQNKYLDPFQAGRLRIPQHLQNSVDWQGEILQCIRNMVTCFEDQKTGFEAAIKGLLYLIVSIAAGQQSRGGSPGKEGASSADIDRIKRVLSFVDAHFQDKIRLADLATMVNMSEGYFCRFFKRMTNKRPTQYINDLRVNRAAKLLKDTDLSILNIAMDVGFEDVSYFIKRFRNIKHCTPGDFREMEGV